MSSSVIEKYINAIESIDPIRLMGYVSKVEGVKIETKGIVGKVGELCKIYIHDGILSREVPGEIIGFYDDKETQRMIVMPYYDLEGISSGCLVKTHNKILTVKVSEELKGRILNGIGEPIDGKRMLYSSKEYPIFNMPPDPLKRPRIKDVMVTGIKAIDSFLTLGKGQRVGIFAGSGVGKSTLLGMIARYAKADVNVIALIGERGREVKDFIEKDLGEEGLKKSVLVVATSDTSPLMRIRGAYTATAIAEFFRDQGYSVNFMMDSVTRFSRAQREIGLAAGEPPTSSGFPPSVFTTLPKLLERTGTSEKGSITAFYTVLVEGDDFNEPITDTVRGILDGHIVLKRALAEKAHYPAIDILSSVSRLMLDITTPEHRNAALKLKELYAIYKDQEDLINIGAYQKGSNPKIDLAIKKYPSLIQLLRQDVNEKSEFEHTLLEIVKMARDIR
ncbi:MAG TPA: FliI/YscN family ATPase [Spirochaetota bacterium]|nr:FliI/YscN family ATPase [Spirochaetota bacterium]HOM38397.1 FliI/YscN family ATPase [Spirochaetota bacterium]HPQ48385.1 FliI/YscN family ATPase [Spirochaetota bacterium]